MKATLLTVSLIGIMTYLTWFYVDNRNIRGKHFYKDGLHLMEEGKIILARNLIFCLNKATSNHF